MTRLKLCCVVLLFSGALAGCGSDGSAPPAGTDTEGASNPDPSADVSGGVATDATGSAGSGGSASGDGAPGGGGTGDADSGGTNPSVAGTGGARGAGAAGGAAGAGGSDADTADAGDAGAGGSDADGSGAAGAGGSDADGSGAAGAGGSSADDADAGDAGVGGAGGAGAAGEAGTGAAGTGGDAGSDDTQAPTFSDVYAILDARCSGLFCHGGSQGGLSIASQATAYDELVGAESTSCPGQQRVVSGDPDASVLVQAIERGGGCAPAMPRMAAPLAADDIATIRAWIDAGALNN